MKETKLKVQPRKDYVGTTAVNKKAMLAAMEKSLGVVSTAARSAGIDRKNHYNWMDSDAEYRQKVIDIDNIAIDFAESKLRLLIENGDVAATIFFLKTRGKSRGYVERSEYDVRVVPVIEIVDGSAN